MTSISTRMPPFAGLLTFEAVIRLGSMTLAADELGLTQSAVSHRIRALEVFFGVPLLERLNPGLRATDAGTRLVEEILPLLGAIASLRHRIGSPSDRRIFRVGLNSSLLTWWLSPRLSSLSAAFPDLSIEVWTWETAVEATRTKVDLALLWLPIELRRDDSRQISFPLEHVFPVAAPNLVKTFTPKNWWDLPLIAKGRRGEETGREWSWATWVGSRSGHEAMRFRDIGSSLQAAVEGTGVALGRSLLVVDALRQNRLIRLTTHKEIHACSKIQVARWEKPNDRHAHDMASWLVASAERSLAPE